MSLASIVLYDTPISVQQLYPLSLTRSIADVRRGIFTLREWYHKTTNLPVEVLTSSYLNQSISNHGGTYLCIDSSVPPSSSLWQQLQTLGVGTALEDNYGLIGYCTQQIPVFGQFPLFFSDTIKANQSVARITHPMDWVKHNAATILHDMELFNPEDWVDIASNGNQVFGNHEAIMGTGATVKASIFNTEEGPVIIGKNALIMEGCLIKGPVYIGENAVVKMGAQIYPGTTIGKNCTAGGEIKNSILGDYSNKAHHGYLGDSIVGQWCNLGAGTSNSNVKNTAGTVKMWSNYHHDFVIIGKKAGFVMGDYCRTAIHTAINTGSTFGVCCNIFGETMPAKNTPSFTWGNHDKYIVDKAINDLENWYGFKNVPFDKQAGLVMQHLYENSGGGSKKP